MALTDSLGLHITNHGLKYTIPVVAIMTIIYIAFAVITGVKLDEATGKVVVVIVASLTVVWSTTSLILIAVAEDKELGALKDQKKEIVLGLFAGAAVSIIGLLSIFGLLKV